VLKKEKIEEGLRKKDEIFTNDNVIINGKATLYEDKKEIFYLPKWIVPNLTESFLDESDIAVEHIGLLCYLFLIVKKHKRTINGYLARDTFIEFETSELLEFLNQQANIDVEKEFDIYGILKLILDKLNAQFCIINKDDEDKTINTQLIIIYNEEENIFIAKKGYRYGTIGIDAINKILNYELKPDSNKDEEKINRYINLVCSAKLTYLYCYYQCYKNKIGYGSNATYLQMFRKEISLKVKIPIDHIDTYLLILEKLELLMTRIKNKIYLKGKFYADCLFLLDYTKSELWKNNFNAAVSETIKNNEY